MNEKIRLQLLERARHAAKLRSLSRKTENAYLNHIRRFLEFSGKAEADDVEADEIRAFLNHLQTSERLAISTRNQALYALIFFCREVFGQKLSPRFKNLKPVCPPEKSLVVLTLKEVKAVLSNLTNAPYLIAALMYGAGLRLSEAVGLRVGDVDFGRREIIVRDVRTGAKDRTTVLPNLIVADLQKHLAEVKFTHEDDCLLGYGKVWLPLAVKRQYPNAAGEWRWQYVFPSCKLTAAGDGFYRHHLAESTVQKAVGEAAAKAQIVKKTCCQTFRYSFAVRLFERNTDVHIIQNMLGHKNLKTTMSYFNLFGIGGSVVQSPLDY
jgi:integron integrase